MPKQSARLNRVFQALSDPTRRSVLERLGGGSAAVSELARPFKMALPSFLQHMDVLEACGLVRSRKNGRVRIYRLAPQPLKNAERWMAEQRATWERRLDQLDSYLHTMKRERMSAQKPDPKLDLVFERIVDVPRERIWAAWTQPEHIKKWFTPAPWKTVECEIDLRPGGIFRTMIQSPEGDKFPNLGCYLEVVEQERIVWTVALGPGYRPKNPVMDVPIFTAILTFEKHAKGTKYTALVMHKDEEGCKTHEKMGFYDGWGAAFEQLLALTKTM